MITNWITFALSIVAFILSIVSFVTAVMNIRRNFRNACYWSWWMKKNNDTELPYIIEDGYVYDDYENMNAYAKENAEFFMHNKNNRFIGSSNFDSWFNRTLGDDKFYYEVVSNEKTGSVKEILVYKKGCVKMLLSNNGDICTYTKIDSKRANELLKKFAQGIAEHPFIIVDKSNITFTDFKDEED